MNTSELLIIWATIIWSFSFIFLFIEEGLQEYLLRFRYRELREGLDEKRKSLKFLFSLVRDRKRYIRIFKTLPVIFTLLLGIAITKYAAVIFYQFEIKLTALTLGIGILLTVPCLALQTVLVYRIPKIISRHYPISYLNFGALFLICVYFILRPIMKLMDLAPLPAASEDRKKEISFDEIDSDLQILALGKESVKLTPATEKIALRALDLSDISVYDILLPRNQVQIFDINDGTEANLIKARKTGHTRFPLCVDDLDHCLGIIHIKDIFRGNQPVNSIDFKKIARPILKVDQEEPLDRVLQTLRQKRIHMALVEDEFGGIIGVLTMERILEELVGEIHDEFDKEDRMIVLTKKGDYRIAGLAPVHEVEAQLGLENLENDEVSSFGGLVTHHLGHIPEKGESFRIGSLLVTILERNDRRVILTNVRKLPEPTND